MKPSSHRHANSDFPNHVTAQTTMDNSTVTLALLMDIRAELRGLNDTFDCRNFRDVPTRLRAIDRELKIARRARETQK